MKKAIGVILTIVLSSIFLGNVYDTKLEEKLFYGVGHFGSAMLYQSFINIGVIADGYAKKIYPAEQAKAILQTSTHFLTLSENVLKELSAFSISETDRKTLTDMRDIVNDLRQEADHFMKYLTSKKDEDVKNFDSFRVSAWGKIRKMMDIKED